MNEDFLDSARAPRPANSSDAVSVEPGGGSVPIRCSRVISTLGEYADGSLSPADRARVESHLASCASCARDAKEYLEIIQLAGALPTLNPSSRGALRLRSLIADAIKRSAPIDNSMDETVKDSPGID